MALDDSTRSITIPATADLSASQFKLIKRTAGLAVLATAGTDIVIGPLQNKPLLGLSAEVAIDGVALVMAGAAVADGAQLMSDASARAITATSTNRAFGIAMSAAAAAGDIIPVLVNVTRPLIA